MAKKIIDKKDSKYVIERYRSRIEEHGVTMDSLAVNTKEVQDVRHAMHCSSFRTKTPTVLDIGCGIGMFLEYMKKHKVAYSSYTGYDILPEYIDYCTAHYPKANFELRNVLESGIKGTYDNITLSQVLNNKYSFSDNYKVMEEMMSICYKHCNVGFSIDMRSNYVNYKVDYAFYYSPEKIFAFAKSLSKSVVLRHDYRPFEFCIQVYKDDFNV